MLQYLFIFRLVICIILFIVYSQLLRIIPSSWVPQLNKLFVKLFLYFANFTRIHINNKQVFDSIVNSDQQCLIVSNHTTLYDSFALMASLGNVCFFANIENMNIFPGLYDICNNLKCVFLNKAHKGNAIKIKEKVESRQQYQPLLVVYPDACGYIPIGCNIAPFKTGAFSQGFDVLPVLIEYTDWTIDPTFLWYKGEEALHCMFKPLIDTQCHIHITVLDKQSKKQNETIEQYKDRIYQYMSRNKVAKS